MCNDEQMHENKSNIDKFTDDNRNDVFNIYDVGNNDGLDQYGIANIPNSNKDCIKKKMDITCKKSVLMHYFLKHMVDYVVYD